MAESNYESRLEQKLSFMECVLKLNYSDEYLVHRKKDVITLSKPGNVAATLYPIAPDILFVDIYGREHYHIEEFLSQIAEPEYKVIAMLNPESR